MLHSKLAKLLFKMSQSNLNLNILSVDVTVKVLYEKYRSLLISNNLFLSKYSETIRTPKPLSKLQYDLPVDKEFDVLIVFTGVYCTLGCVKI